MTIDTELGEVLAENEAEHAAQIAAVIRSQLLQRYPADHRPARRDAHPKAHGCVRAEFRVEQRLPPELAQGVFVPGKVYPAWIRFSNGDSDPTRSDAQGDARGMAIKLMGVPGEKLLPEESTAQTQDFLMISHPVFLVDDPGRYLSLFQRLGSSNPLVRLTAPLAIGIEGAWIAHAITARRIASPLAVRYWSTTAYRLGDDRHKQAIKFSARPHRQPSELPAHPAPDFLRQTLIRELAEADASFDFLVQPRSSPLQSVENSSHEWREEQAPFHKVATVHIPRQTFASAARDNFAENLSFTPWHCLPEHRPLGAINRVRRVVYEEISRLRHEMNDTRRAEPTGDEAFD